MTNWIDPALLLAVNTHWLGLSASGPPFDALTVFRRGMHRGGHGMFHRYGNQLDDCDLIDFRAWGV